ncbi:MAG: ABC transporter substrate-binding protein, partial [Planctomycetes bacterium]|nr:ABC transporter substrate-binding protein [Planctomycetota bacterium]
MKRFANTINCRWLLVSALVLGILFTFGCSKKPPEQKEVKIGAISPFTGDGANYGKAARTAIDMAVDEINTKGGVNGAKLVVVYEDDKGNPSDALSAFKKLATVDKVSAVLGPFYSSNVLACAPVANRLKVVLLTGTATSDNIRTAGEYVFRVCPSNDQ